MAHELSHRGNGGRLARHREHPLARMQRDFESIFDRMLGGWLSPFAESEFESMRVWDFKISENDNEITVRAEIPGFDENELDVQLNQNVLTIKAEKDQKGDDREEYRSFYRSVTLPSGLDPDKVNANYQNGVLTLHIPRSEGSHPKRIKIEGGSTGSAQHQQSNKQSKSTQRQGSK